MFFLDSDLILCYFIIRRNLFVSTISFDFSFILDQERRSLLFDFTFVSLWVREFFSPPCETLVNWDMVPKTIHLSFTLGIYQNSRVYGVGFVPFIDKLISDHKERRRRAKWTTTMTHVYFHDFLLFNNEYRPLYSFDSEESRGRWRETRDRVDKGTRSTTNTPRVYFV